MYVGEGDVQDLIKWFQRNSRAQWIGFFVAGDTQYNKLLNDVLAHGDVLDVVSGFHIDLFLFGAGQSINLVGGGRDVKVDAAPLTELSQEEDYSAPTIQHIASLNSSVARKKQIVKASATATHRIAEVLGLEVDDLPSLTLIRKDFDFAAKSPKLVLRTRGQADAEFVIQFIRSMRRIMERHSKAASMKLPSEKSIALARNVLPKIEAENSAITKFTVRAQRRVAILSERLLSIGVNLELASSLEAILSGTSSLKVLQEIALMHNGNVSQLENVFLDSQMSETLRLLEKDRIAVINAKMRVEQFKADLPSEGDLLAYIAINESIFADLNALLKTFDRKISYKIAAETISHFFHLTTEVLTKAKKLVKLVVALKSGGASLLT